MHKNMYYKNLIIDIFAVTFRKEGVDWNFSAIGKALKLDRHLPQGRCGLKFSCILPFDGYLRHLPQGRCGLKSASLPDGLTGAGVTFRKEGVDWNKFLRAWIQTVNLSPSARKVWIEIFIAQLNIQFAKRHLLQRRCGLKFGIALHTDILLPSPSARKVWIEIRLMCNVQLQACCHLLQGRCGLKSPLRRRIGQILRHLP